MFCLLDCVSSVICNTNTANLEPYSHDKELTGEVIAFVEFGCSCNGDGKNWRRYSLVVADIDGPFEPCGCGSSPFLSGSLAVPKELKTNYLQILRKKIKKHHKHFISWKVKLVRYNITMLIWTSFIVQILKAPSKQHK